MKLAFREYGSGEKSLVILHGLFGQSDNWNSLAKKFAEQSLRVFAVDLRNHGLSPHSDEFSFSLLADDLAQFIRDQKLNHPILMGHSLGGKTVLYHEKLHPGVASALIIVDMSAREYQPQHIQVLEGLNAVDFSSVKSRRDVEEVLSNYISDAGTRQFLLKNVYWVDERAGQLGWRFNLKSLTNHYPEVNKAVPVFKSETPTLVVRGARSNYINEDDLADFRTRFSYLEVSTVPDAGHWVHAESPAAFFEVVNAFISGLTA